MIKNPTSSSGDMGLIPGLGIKDPTCHEATYKPVHYNYRAQAQQLERPRATNNTLKLKDKYIQ